MSKALKTVGTIAVGVALVASGIGAFGGAGILGASFSSIATYAGLVGAAAQIGSRLTAKKPPARGSITQTVIAAEPPRPYLMGECYSAGIMRHQAGYGATLKKVPNPYLWQVMVYSGVGPVEQLVEKQFDFGTIGSYYSGFYDTDTQLGARPESTALVPPYGTAPGWTSSSKLSGLAAIGWNLKFDKEGKVFSSGVPLMGAVWKGEMAYDPRLDNSQPGGSGSHVLGTESTYTYSTNPALHAGTYAYGRFENGKKVFGLGIPSDGIDWAAISAWANDCDTNGWEIAGTIYEGGDQSGPNVKAGNLDDICAAGAARWFTTGAVLSFDWQRPRVSLATFTDKDIMEGGANITALQSHRDRFNEVSPQYRSQAHNWELITAEPITGATYVTEDGETKPQTWPFNLVKDATQAGQLATYAMTDSREIGPVNLPLGIDWSFYKPGDTLTWDSDILGDTLKLVVVERTPDVQNLETGFTFKTETDAKHAYALGQVAVAPPTPVIGQTAEERDAVASGSIVPSGYISALILSSYISGSSPLSGTDAGTDATINISAHNRVYSDKTTAVSSGSITALAYSTFYAVYYDDGEREGGAVSYAATTTIIDSFNSTTYPDRHFVGYITTPANGDPDTGGIGGAPPGGGDLP